MRTIILGLLGATMLGSVAQAACNDIPNPTRFNPTELSEYQECWLDEYKADETAGIIGSLAWVRLDGQYFSAPLSQLKKMSGSYSERFIEAITPALEEARAEQQESIRIVIEDLQEIARLKEEVKRLEMANADLKDMIKEKNDRIKELEAQISNAVENINENTESGLEIRIENGATTPAEDAYNATEENVAVTDFDSNDISVFRAGQGSNQFAILEFHDFNFATLAVVDLNSVDITMEMAQAIEGAIEAAVSEAYNDGYADGYAAGYTDGFEDGVASTQ